MKLYLLHRTQKLAVGLDKAWEFFSNPNNLALITPPRLNLRPVSEVPERMFEGMTVVYRVRPFPGFASDWVSEITHVREPHCFVDEQRSGPYEFWHHQHHFREMEGGTLAEDLVHYALPFGPLGRMAKTLVVQRQLNEIFEFRREALAKIFGDIGR